MCSPEKKVRRAVEINAVMASVPLVGIGCIPQQFIPLMLGLRSPRGGASIPVATVLIDLACNLVYTGGAALQARRRRRAKGIAAWRVPHVFRV